jgi:hypothetical protein
LAAAGTRICSYCSFSMPVSLDRCPHCARPSLFPNVEMASDPAEVAALDRRYSSAMTRAVANGTAAVAGDLERETATRSRVVISRDSSDVYRLACGDNQLYTTYYRLVEIGFRAPSDSKWDSIRATVDSMMFPNYHQEVRFGALTLDEAGLLHYGDCHLILKTDMVDFRTTAFTANSAAFVEGNHFVIPAGHRATWARRGRLAVAKLASALTPSTAVGDLPRLLKSDGATPEGDSFVETHVYGSISMRTVERVSMSRSATRAVKVSALKEKLEKLGVPLVIV